MDQNRNYGTKRGRRGLFGTRWERFCYRGESPPEKKKFKHSLSL